MNKAGFEEQVLKILQDIENRRVDFLLKIPIFSQYSKTRLLKFYLDLTSQKYYRGSVVYNEGDEVTDVYIIFNGQFEIEKKLAHEDRRK
mmetsp:Transcript_36795/g.48303  ORF Transcript_36795/g.48303 Transcript_36795/m.48303 type:complete len:89 (-) Transcript_36795:1746-2012(-)